MVCKKYCKEKKLKENSQNEDKKKNLKKFLNKKNLLIVSVMIIIILVVTVIILSFRTTSTEGLYKAFDNMKNLDSYKVIINNISRYDNSYYDEGEKEEELALENVIEKDVEKITDAFGTRYFYNGKTVKSEEYEDGEIWYYERDWMINTVPLSYKAVYDEMFNILSNYKFINKKNIFKFVNEKYIDENGDEWEKIWDLESGLEDILESLTNGYSYNSTVYSEDYGVFNVTDALADVSIIIDRNKISSITLHFIAECYDEDDEWLDCSKVEEAREIYKLVINFSGYGTAKVDFPKNFNSDLEKTTAGDWIGKYKGTLTCPDGKTYDESIELHDSVDIDGNIFWDIDYNVFDCESGYYTKSSGYYTYENNKIILYDFFKEDILTEFELSESKLVEKDKAGKVLLEFKRMD